MSNVPGHMFTSEHMRKEPSRYTLPALSTSFIGREGELNEVKSFFFSTRLLTLTGTGGIGKTHLTLQIAHDLAQRKDALVADNLWFVTLAHLHDPAEILPALAQAFGLDEELEQVHLTTLCAFLSPKKALLILDGCEHLVEACARLIETLLQTCPALSILATSRETLRVSGEIIYCLAPLAAPSPKAIFVPDDLMHYGATALFLERARAIHPYFRITDRNMHMLAEICQQLDGLPLAVELAAARIRVMSVEQIAERVRNDTGSGFDLLTGGRRTALPHQRSLRATLDWSYNLLTPIEQRLLLRLAVFAGGWTLEAAQAICCDTWIAELSVLDGLTQLVDKSLLLVEKQASIQTLSTGEIVLTEQARYTFLQTVRHYALEKALVSSEAQEVQKKHLEYFLSLAEKAEPALRGSSQLSWLAYLELEHENFRVALEFAHRYGLHETGLRLANALWWFWVLRARFNEGRTWLEKRALLDEGVSPQLRARALYHAGTLTFFQGDLERLDVLTEKSLALFYDLHDTQGVAVSLCNLVHVALRQGNHERAQRLGEESVALARSVGDRWYVGLTLLPLAHLKMREKDYTSASMLVDESLRIFRALRDRWGIAYAFDTLGQLADRQHDYPSGVSCYEQSLKLLEQLNDPIGTARALLHLGLNLILQEKYTQASAILEKSLNIYRTSERRIGIARALLGIGRIKQHFHDYQEAALLLEESLHIFQEHGDVNGFAETLANLMQIALQQSQFQQIWLFLQHSLGARYRLDNALDMAATLEAIAASERTQRAFAGRMRPAGWLMRVIGILQAAKRGPEAEPTGDVSCVRAIVEENVFVTSLAQPRLAPAHPCPLETTTALSHWSASANVTSLFNDDGIPTPPTRLQQGHLPFLPSPLTGREQEVLELVERGLSNAQIAQRLVVSVGTVRTHLASIYNKLGVSSRTAAVHSAHERHLL